ncbi:MAG: helix-turn-helix transcriptional regulator [Chloroflexi bacterium]|nr:helix-turn-helix transcriptional regulator [Chloroflexota bacterium]
MPPVSLSLSMRHAQQMALERIRRLSCAGLDVAGYLDEVNPIVSHVVPNQAGEQKAPYWYTVDPASHLVTSVYGQGCDVEPSEYMKWELFAEDVMKTADVLANPRGVQTLHEVTDGHPERSPIYKETMVPHGMSQELLVALRSSTGENWGATRLNRAPGDPMFSPHEIGFMAAAAPLIAEGVRRGLLVGEATDPDQPNAPGLAVIGLDGRLESTSSSAQEWFARFPADHGWQDGVPISVFAVAADAVRDAEQGGGGGASTVRIPMMDGGWAVVQGAVLSANGDSAVTVIIEPAHPNRIAPLLMSIYGLTDREREVTRQVMLGGSTTEVAGHLRMSPHTLQQHLKNIFEKTCVSSRGELVAKIYFDCYDLRARDNHERIRVQRSIRGGPKVN